VETKTIGLDKLKQLLLEVIERNKQKTEEKRCATDS
jgi:microcompartment protein CcmK/EutM